MPGLPTTSVQASWAALSLDDIITLLRSCYIWLGKYLLISKKEMSSLPEATQTQLLNKINQLGLHYQIGGFFWSKKEPQIPPRKFLSLLSKILMGTDESQPSSLEQTRQEFLLQLYCFFYTQ